ERGVPAGGNGHAAALNGHLPAPRPEPQPRVEAAGSNGGTAAAALAAVTATEVAAVAAQRALGGKRVRRLIEDYREVGHLAADLDPLGLVDRSGHRLRIEDYGLGDADLDTLVTSEDVMSGEPAVLRTLLGQLDETYCRHMGVELAHIHDSE